MRMNCRNLQSLVSRICMSGLTLLGFSCSDAEDNEPLCMYGTPTAAFEIKGSVTSADGNAVGDAEVRVTEQGLPSDRFVIDSDMTETDGTYDLRGTIVGRPEGTLKIVCIPADASLEADSVEVKLTKVENGSGGWNTGKGEATVNFTLKKKTAE